MDKIASIFFVFLFCGSAVGSRTQLSSGNVNVHASLAADDGVCSTIVKGQNYPCEEHKDAITWLLSPPDQSLAFLLADNGFDVWLVSSRGTKYSRGHTSLSPDDAAFWDWSWDELVAYDLPATFQYVYDQTGRKIHYVGHSMGTLIVLAAVSKGQLLDKLRSAALLCPIAYVGDMTSPIARNGAENLLAETLYWLNIHEFSPGGEAVTKLLLHICKQKGIDCTNLLTSFTGQNCCLNSSIISVFLQHEPQSTSTKNMIHFAQMIREGTINMYDYGDENENNKHYGQATPPSYDMTNIPTDVPLFLAYGGADALSVSQDVKLLLDSLHDHEGDKLVVEYREDYAHADYVMSVNAKQNKKHYGQATPPSFDMTNIPTDVPLFLAYGGADALSVSQDVKLLLDSLHDHEGDKLVVEYREDYAHADYVMSVNAKQVVYVSLMAFLGLH
ncbi:hypothetical protein BUALT_Bualt03G0213900 [Buddleja alternifolia]|uniref:AB hydrolase-1 domain-containing protein n=1 Tax=Buddleja alternifolia TaxID=168488 RepID=A0AAV6XWF0_9LAMI|nr:hypothetical protein BUALT_Bualt03G0213900 [Buddleja alternifolia]